MLTKIAWLNIWRTKTRSLVVIFAIAIGVLSLIFLVAFMRGMGFSYVNSAVEKEHSHVQIHQKEFLVDKATKFFLTAEDQNTIQKLLDGDPNVEGYSFRTIANGSIQTAKGSGGVLIKGIMPKHEAKVTALESYLEEGKYFTEKKKNEILVSRRMADKYKLKLRTKVVLSFQDLNNDFVYGGFRVVGIYNSHNGALDDVNVFVKKGSLGKLLGNPEMAHETALVVNELENLQVTDENLKSKLPGLLVRNYKEIAPELAMFNSQINLSTTIFIIIVMIALLFGIINTMLMAILERIKELGMMMAVGMNKTKVFLMIVIETFMLGLIGAPLGVFLGYLSLKAFASGIDLSAFEEGIEKFGMATLIVPDINSGSILQIVVAVFITALIGSLYPAYRAVKLKPVEALRHI